MTEVKFIRIFLLTSDDLNFRNDRPQRIIILENLNWLYAARDKTWSSFKLFQYLHWVKETLDTRLCQIWTGLHTDWRLLLFVDLLFLAICKWTLFVYTSYFLYHRWVVVENLIRKKETASRLCHSRAVPLLQNPTTFIAKI